MISKEHLDTINEWKEDGLVIGFMDNNFDGLDLNHLKMLKYASDNCDKLVIGLYNDYTIKMNDSIDKPEYNYNYRRDILNNLDYVDLIICIDELSPKNLIKLIKPHKIFTHQYSDEKMEEVEIISKLNDIEIVKMDSLIVEETKPQSKCKAIIIDIDGTIYDEETDEPIYDILLIVNMLKKLGYHVIISTYRDESCREKTECWLNRYIKYDKLFMRPTNERISSYKWKEQVYKNHIMNQYDVEYVFENDKDDYNMYGNYNLTSLLIHID